MKSRARTHDFGTPRRLLRFSSYGSSKVTLAPLGRQIPFRSLKMEDGMADKEDGMADAEDGMADNNDNNNDSNNDCNYDNNNDDNDNSNNDSNSHDNDTGLKDFLICSVLV